MQKIGRIISLGNKLMEETENNSQPFKKEWLNRLIEFYRKNQGKSLIHVSDLPDAIFLKFNGKGNKILSDLDKFTRIRSIKNYLIGSTYFIRLSNLKKSSVSIKNINDLEPFIKEIKTTKSGYGKSIKNPRFPINLNNRFGAILLGNFPDAFLKTGEFGSKDKAILDELADITNKHIGSISSTLWYRTIYHLQLSPLIGVLYKLSGLNNDNRQIITNNAIPLWTFFASKNFKRTLLQKLWDAEGSAPSIKWKDMCFGQSVVINKNINKIPIYPIRKTFKKCENKKIILDNPPNLLISLQLLLYEFGIMSFIRPHRLYKKKSGSIVCDWQLKIRRYTNIKKFYDEIDFGLKRKQQKLEKCLEGYKRLCPEPREKREEELMDVIIKFDRFTIKDIANRSNLSIVTIRNYLVRLRKKGKIERVRIIPQIPSSFLNEYKIKRD